MLPLDLRSFVAKADPFTRAYVVICDDREPGCVRLEHGEWLEGTHEDHATPAQREAAWSGVLRIYPERRNALVRESDDDRHDLATTFDALPPADAALIPR